MLRLVSIGMMAAVLTLGSASAQAFWAWMRDSVVNQFTDADWEILKGEAQRVLDDEADGAIVDWHNPESGNGGSIRPLESFTYQGMRCRKTPFRHASADGLKGQGVYNLCRQDDGTWKFVAESSLTAS